MSVICHCWGTDGCVRRIRAISDTLGPRTWACSVPLNRDAVAVLEEQLGKNPQYCFTYRGQPIRWDVTNTAWHTALRNAGIQDFRFHDLRHTWASWHRQAGTSCDELKDLGGWKSRTMVDRYAKFATENLRVAASRIEGGSGGNVIHMSRFCHGQDEKKGQCLNANPL